MDAIKNIMTRRSVRNYTDKPISSEALETILRAAMAGPSCTNARDWAFIVVRSKEVLNKMADANGAPAAPLRRCNVGILILGDKDKAFRPAPDYWIIDGAIAGQNICLSANALGIGSVWLGTYPQMERVEGQIKLFGLPENMIPHSVIALGYPDEAAKDEPMGPPPGDEKKPMGPPPKMAVKGAYEPELIHYDRW